jgi:hypothetical protein
MSDETTDKPSGSGYTISSRELPPPEMHESAGGFIRALGFYAVFAGVVLAGVLIGELLKSVF